MSIVRGSAASLVLCALTLALAQPAGADAGSDLLQRLRDGFSNVKSYAIEVSGSTGTIDGGTSPIKGETVVVRPDRSHTTFSGKDGTAEVFVADCVAYSRLGDRPWEARKLEPCRLDPTLDLVLARDRTVAVLADRVEGVSTVGAFSFHSPPNPAGKFLAASTVCTYDKKTFLLRECTTRIPDMNLNSVSVFGRWNDPANAVVLPPNLPTPAAAPPPTLPPYVVPSPNRGAPAPSAAR